MTEPALGALKGARIWLSASIPEDTSGSDVEIIRKFITDISIGIFRAGGSIIHGAHPTVWQTLLDAASRAKEVRDPRDCLTLVVSEFFSNESKALGVSLDDWRRQSTVQITPLSRNENRTDARIESIGLLRRWIADRCDAVLILGGKWWHERPSDSGTVAELELARIRGLPCFLLGGFGGAAEGYLEAAPEILRSLKNGLDEATNRKLAIDRSIDKLADLIIGQLARLPLVRGKPTTGTSFRILALDGGGIKGTFTASVLNEWAKLATIDLVSHFDLVAGTSTGGFSLLVSVWAFRQPVCSNFTKSEVLIFFR
jgi:hypothetical protein